MLNAQAFGKLQLAHRQTVLDHFPTRHVEELLGFLLLKPQVHHTREKLITQLWPEVDLSQGRHRFSIVLSRLRKMFLQLEAPFDHYVHATREWVAFVPEQPFTFDCEQFLAHYHAGFRADNLTQRESLLRAAVALYRADLMEGIYADWCLSERERLARLRLRALGQLMHCCLQREAYAEAIDFGHAILQDDPLREEVHRALMECYTRQDRHDLAARQYQICFDLLQRELNELPLVDTTELYQQIMATRARAALDNPRHSPAHKQAIQAALADFQQAAGRLNALL